MTREPTDNELRVASAICLASPHDDHNFDRLEVARAAIQAMEPDDAMVAAFKQTAHHRICDDTLVRDGFRAMINAASPPIK